MFLINRDQNRISALKAMSFSELKFREREHLQEWITNNPASLGEDLLIIQKEFSGFSDTRERLDLLALDKLGNLVIIENKLDDSGRDVTWQALKYVSYCASLSRQDIIRIYQDYLGGSASAEENLADFFEGQDMSEIVLNQGLTSQRIMLVAANFRKEVTSTVLWLSGFKIRIQCFEVTPYALGEELLLNIEQILPTKNTEEFVIGIAAKAQEEIEVQETLKARHVIRLKFWQQFLAASAEGADLFSNNSPAKATWIGRSLGVSGVTMYVGVSKSYARAEVYLNRGSKEENKKVYDFFL